MLLFSATGSDLELLLNLCWLLLIGPGIYLWMRRQRNATSALQFSIALISLLFLLFPVISVTDDLHAMQQEMEESGPSKRTLKQATKSATGHDFSSPAVDLPSVAHFLPTQHVLWLILDFVPVASAWVGAEAPVSRPPPTLFLA